MNDESIYWQLFRTGDEPSFKYIFERYNRLLFNYGFKFTPDEGLIEDSIQEFFVKLWSHRETINDTASVKNYVYKAFRRILTKNIAKKIRQAATDSSQDDLAFHVELPRDITLIREERLREIREKLELVLQKMTSRQREVIHLRFFEELSYEEIADIMGLSVKDTYKLYYRAMDSMRKYFSVFGLAVVQYLISQIQLK